VGRSWRGENPQPTRTSGPPSQGRGGRPQILSWERILCPERRRGPPRPSATYVLGPRGAGPRRTRSQRRGLGAGGPVLVRSPAAAAPSTNRLVLFEHEPARVAVAVRTVTATLTSARPAPSCTVRVDSVRNELLALQAVCCFIQPFGADHDAAGPAAHTPPGLHAMGRHASLR
jgi:hypothetical protein